jgi:hypothetical protein
VLGAAIARLSRGGGEEGRGKPIRYDTGDFVDDYALDEEPRNDPSALFLARARPPAIEGLDLVPVRIDRMRVNLARGDARDAIARRLTAPCAEVHPELVPRQGPLCVSPATGTRSPAGGGGR